MFGSPKRLAQTPCPSIIADGITPGKFNEHTPGTSNWNLWTIRALSPSESAYAAIRGGAKQPSFCIRNICITKLVKSRSQAPSFDARIRDWFEVHTYQRVRITSKTACAIATPTMQPRTIHRGAARSELSCGCVCQSNCKRSSPLSKRITRHTKSR